MNLTPSFCRPPFKAWQKIAVFYAIAGPAMGSLVFTVANIVDTADAGQPIYWASVVSFTLFAAAMGIGAAFIPAFVVGSAYALLAVRRRGLRGTAIGRVCVSFSIGLVAGALLGLAYGSMSLFLAACGVAAAACSALLERSDYFEWLAQPPRLHSSDATRNGE